MLSENRLCEIYLNIGEENMCHTCKTYPRSYNKVNDRIEASLTLSCIEVARNILLSKESIEFSLDDNKVSSTGINKTIDTHNAKYTHVRNFDEIRSFCIGLIQKRRYSIEERLSILGLFIKNLSEISDDSLVLNLIQDYQSRIDSGLYDGMLDSFEVEKTLNAQTEFCTGVYNVILSKGISDQRFIDKFKIAAQYLEIDKEDVELRISVLKNSMNNEYREFIKGDEYIYENYLVSYMFKTLFPISDMSLSNTYNDLVIRFSLIKMTLIGLSGYYKNEMNLNYAVEFIQSFVKIVEHDTTIVGKLNDYLVECNINTLAHMMIMIGK